LADWVTISQVATAGGTLVLAIATFSSIKSANRSARVAERSMLAAQRPILIPSRDTDSPETIRFGDGQVLVVGPHGGTLEFANNRLYMAIALRNGAAGVAVIHGWRASMRQEGVNSSTPAPPLDEFRRQARDLYIPAQQTGFWQGAIRDPADPDYATVLAAARSGERLNVDLLYGDYEGGQRAIARFGIASGSDPNESEETRGKADVLRYWNVDGSDPR
jgi:hypothetical protein